MRPVIGIVTDHPGWHGAQLATAFARRGCDAPMLSLRHASIELQGADARVLLDGRPVDQLDALFVRGVPGGSLQQVVHYLNVLHAAEASGVPVYNRGRVIERSVDKALTSALLARDGIAVPPTLVTTDAAQAARFVHQQTAAGAEVVCKPLFGSQGKGLLRLRCASELPPVESVNGVWYLQRFIVSQQQGASDWRLLVVAGQTVALMRRTCDGWITNHAKGGRCHAGVVDSEAHDMARRATALLGMAYAGVDLMRDLSGQWWLIEVNSVPAWRGLQSVTGLDVAGLLADDLLARLRCPQDREVQS